MDACEDRIGGMKFAALVAFSDNVKMCRPKWFGLAWGCQEKGRRIRSKKGGKVARARRREWSSRDDCAKECPPCDDGVAHERNVGPPIADSEKPVLVGRGCRGRLVLAAS